MKLSTPVPKQYRQANKQAIYARGWTEGQEALVRANGTAAPEPSGVSLLRRAVVAARRALRV